MKWVIIILITVLFLSSVVSAVEGKLVFVSSETYDGNLGGLSGADVKCQGLADTAGLPGTYKALLSTDSVDAADRLTHWANDYILYDGTKVADGWSDLTGEVLDHEIDLDEYGNTDSERRVWTNTDTDGTVVNSAHHCSRWTDGDLVLQSVHGRTDYRDWA